MPIEYRPFVFAAMGVCALMMLVSLALVARRGLSGYLMSVAFGAFAALLYALMENWPKWTHWTFGIVLGVMLIGDFVYRSSRQQK